MLTALRRTLPLLLCSLCTVLVCEIVTARISFADVYLEIRHSLSQMLAQAVGMPERQPRDLMLNGTPLSFTPYRSDRPIDAILNDYVEALTLRIRPATAKPADGLLPGMMDRAVAAANAMVKPKVARMKDGFATVTQFFDGDGNAARDYLLERMIFTPAPQTRMPGVTLVLRRPAEAPSTDVIASRFDDAPALIGSFSKDADPSRLPSFLRPPPGARLIADLGDRGTTVISRTILSSSTRAPEQWAIERRSALALEGFELDPPSGGHGSLLSFGARRGAVEADIAYVASTRADEFTEIIEIRQPGIKGSEAEGSTP
jgi:hypothetical protein